MELKIIPSPIYKDSNGIPAYKSGEWPGVKPNHFERTRLMIKQIRKNLNFERKSSSKYIPEKKSSEYIFKPCLKMVKSYLKNVRRQHLPDKGRKHEFNELNSSQKNCETYDHNLFFGRKKRMEKNFSNNFSSFIILPKIEEKIKKRKKNLTNSISEINIEKIMNRKKRINSLEQQRNYYKLANKGDKNYRYVDCSQDFFKEGGLIPGSTNIFRVSENYNKIKNNIYEYMDLNVKSLDTDKIWDNKLEREREENEIYYVSNLENWDLRNIKEEKDENKENNTQDENQKRKKKN